MDLECSKFPLFSRSMLQKPLNSSKSKKFSKIPKRLRFSHTKFPFQNPHRKFHIKTEKQTNKIRNEILWLKNYWKENIWKNKIKLKNLGGKLNEILNKLTKGIFYARLSWFNFLFLFFFNRVFSEYPGNSNFKILKRVHEIIVQLFITIFFYVVVLVKIRSTTFLKAKGSRFPKLFLDLKLIEYMPNYDPSKSKMGCSIAHKVKWRVTDGIMKKINQINVGYLIQMHLPSPHMIYCKPNVIKIIEK